MLKTDIHTRADIESLVFEFYARVQKHPTLSEYFARVNCDHHVPIMVNFWENTLFHTGGYEGNPMDVHVKLHQRMPLHAADFLAWKSLFIETVDRLFAGERAEHIKSRAVSIATVMQLKILHGS